MKKQRGDIALLLIVGLVFIGVISGLGYKFWSSAEKAGRLACEHELEVADKALVVQADAAEKEAENHLTDMNAAYEQGLQDAEGKQRVFVTKGASDVAKYPVFSNPACVLPADSLLNLNGARSGVQPAADPTPPAAIDSVRRVPPTIKGPVRGPVPADAARRGPAQ